MFGLKIPSLNVLKNPYVLGGLAAGGALYFILTGQNTGFGPLDTGLRDIGSFAHIEGIFSGQEPAAMKPAPGKTTVVHKSTGVGLGPFPVGQDFVTPANAASYDLRTGGARGYAEQNLTLQFSGVGEFGADDGRLTIA